MTGQLTGQRVENPVAGSRDSTSQALRPTAQGAKQRIRDATADAQEWLTNARALGWEAQHVARRFRPYAEASMKERPMTTLSAACAIGFLLGALWKR